jgi:hypothetical protein
VACVNACAATSAWSAGRDLSEKEAREWVETDLLSFIESFELGQSQSRKIQAGDSSRCRTSSCNGRHPMGNDANQSLIEATKHSNKSSVCHIESRFS